MGLNLHQRLNGKNEVPERMPIDERKKKIKEVKVYILKTLSNSRFNWFNDDVRDLSENVYL